MSKTSRKSNPKRRRVSFSLASPDAHGVSLVGSFNDWDETRHLMKNDGNGTWTKSVMLSPGVHEYKFISDGGWKEDPINQRTVANPFGTFNNVIEVP